MNKSLMTNAVALALVVIGYLLSLPLILSLGLFALSGALTNWLAVHMLFEKVPGLYGSGVIPLRFVEFKQAIRQLLMAQFFTQQSIARFVADNGEQPINLAPVIEQIDLSPAFDGLVNVIQQSSLGGMLAMVGGAEILQPLREPFISCMKRSLCDMTATEEFNALLRDGLAKSGSNPEIQEKIVAMIDHRLGELTPEMVKTMVQDLIKKHLGWLVVWGGVFGGAMGAVAGLVRYIL